MSKMIARMICLMLALIMTLCAAMPVLAEGDTGSETATDVDSLADALGLTDEERELLTELDPSEKVHIEDGDLSIIAELGQGWRNVLLLGNDARSLEGNGRTDTMIIASINQQTGQIKLTSILRDTEVNIPGKKNKYKINTAFRFGGPNLAMKTVNECFGMNISEYAVVNLAGFADIIDAIGGIEMDVTYDEMKHVNNILGYYREDAKQNGAYKGKDFSDLETYGENTHLTGQQALAYSRIRKLDTEYRRTERQREVLTAIGNKLSKQSTFDLFGTALHLWGSIRTNISFFDAVGLGMPVKGDSLAEETVSVGPDGAYDPYAAPQPPAAR